MDKVICVFSSSSNTIDDVYFSAAEALGRHIALSGDVFLYGAGLTGLMGACAKAVHQAGGQVIGVIPEALNEKGIVYDRCDELIVTDNMRQRKAIMDERSDAFIALPGGFGTIEEIMEIITLKQLRYHTKPIVILNINGFYDNLMAQIKTVVDQQFAKPACLDLYFVTSDVSAALGYIQQYVPQCGQERWLTDVEPNTTPAAVGLTGTTDFDYCKIEVFIPKTHLEPIREALRNAGAGHIGNYDSCLSYTDTTGSWRPLPGSSPYDGTPGQVSNAEEYKVETICRADQVDQTIAALKAAHPYEVPVINALPLYKTGYSV